MPNKIIKTFKLIIIKNTNKTYKKMYLKNKSLNLK